MLERMTEEKVEETVAEINRAYLADYKPGKCAFYSKAEKRGEEKIFLYSGDVLPDVPFDRLGMHFASKTPEGMILTIEGAQAVGPTAKKTIEVSEKQAEELYAGKDLDSKQDTPDGIYILKKGGDFLGCGEKKSEKIASLIPKSRRTGRQYQA